MDIVYVYICIYLYNIHIVLIYIAQEIYNLKDFLKITQTVWNVITRL